MRARVLKGVVAAAGLLLILVVALWIATEVRFRRSWDEMELPDVEVRTDADTLARGEYLVWHVIGCPKCHLPHEQAIGRTADFRAPLQGGWEVTAPGMGTIHFPNITPDPETGIGDYTPAELGRVLRTGVLNDGSVGMTMAGVIGDMTDDDLEAVVSYILAQEPVRNEVPPDELGFMFRAVVAWFFDPYDWFGEPMPGPAPEIAPTVERGAYLVNGPAGCPVCHTPRDPISGAPTGLPLSGGNPEPDLDPDMEWSAPNLTPHEGTGRMAAWSEEQFIARMRAGRVYPESFMPWESFSGLVDDDLRAIYRYLRTLEPADRDTGPAYRASGWRPDGP